jgi:hypothetical protein
MFDQYIEFDCAPTCEDDIVQVSEADYMPKMREQAKRMLALVKNKFPNAPGEFTISRVNHDFGTYLEIRYYFDSDNGWDSVNIIESNWPSFWEDHTPVLM